VDDKFQQYAKTPNNFTRPASCRQSSSTSAGWKARPEIREYHANISTNLRLSGLTDNRYLKRVNLGGAVRWEDKGAIGYYGSSSCRRSSPISIRRGRFGTKGHYYVDAFIAYRTKLFSDKVGAKFQVNVRNLGENGRLQPVGALPTAHRIPSASSIHNSLS